MFNNTLTDLLKTFSAHEIREFRDFIYSPYFNKRQAVCSMFDIIIKFHPDYENKFLTKELIFKELFPGKKYNDSSVRVLLHYLTDLTERYLACSRLEHNRSEYYVQLETVLRDRGLNKLFEKNMARALDGLEKSNMDSEEYFFYRFRLISEKTYQQFSSHYAYFDKVMHKTNWENVYNELTVFYLVKSMIIYLNTLVTHSLYNMEFKSQTFANMFSKINITEYEHIPVIQMYYFLIKMHTESRHEQFYFRLKEILSHHKKDFKKFDITGAYVNMGFYCAKRISEGNQKFEKERFELFRNEIIEKTYMMNDGSMSPVFYRNAAIAGLEMNELKWVKNFITDYRSELGRKYRNNYYNYCMALYEFRMKNFENALELVSGIKYDEIYMKLNSKVLHIQLLHDLGYEDSLSDSMESFRHFLNNNKLIPQLKKNMYLNFHKFLNRIRKARFNKDNTVLEMLITSIQKEISLINKKWLLEKLS